MNKTVVGIGEILWDVFPERRNLGGAPLNFALHCKQLGVNAVPVSRLGQDGLGHEARVLMRSLGLDLSHVGTSDSLPTGTVDVTLDGKGHPSYEIRQDVAWDAISVSEDLLAKVTEFDAVCFGSLAQRHETSRTAIHTLLKAMPQETLRIFDINLRQSFYNRQILEMSLAAANVFKLSDEELPVIADLFRFGGSVEQQLSECLKQFGLHTIAYTRGSNGSLLVREDTVHDHPGCSTDVVDTVGAGDSFTATLCVGLLHGHPLSVMNEEANRVAAYVCSQSGATPVLPPEHTFFG